MALAGSSISCCREVTRLSGHQAGRVASLGYAASIDRSRLAAKVGVRVVAIGVLSEPTLAYCAQALVMAGLVPAIHAGTLPLRHRSKHRVTAWMAGTRPAMTVGRAAFSIEVFAAAPFRSVRLPVSCPALCRVSTPGRFLTATEANTASRRGWPARGRP